jgi:hypothetical protein
MTPTEKQINRCECCDFWYKPKDGRHCYMFMDMPDYPCMAWEGGHAE